MVNHVAIGNQIVHTGHRDGLLFVKVHGVNDNRAGETVPSLIVSLLKFRVTLEAGCALSLKVNCRCATGLSRRQSTQL